MERYVRIISLCTNSWIKIFLAFHIFIYIYVTAIYVFSTFALRPCIVIDAVYKQEIKNLMDLFQETDGCAGIQIGLLPVSCFCHSFVRKPPLIGFRQKIKGIEIMHLTTTLYSSIFMILHCRLFVDHCNIHTLESQLPFNYVY